MLPKRHAGGVFEHGSRRKRQPPPPHHVWSALADPVGDQARRSWLDLLDDEIPPVVVEAREADLVVWASPWPGEPRFRIRFDLAGDSGTMLTWTLLHPEEVLDPPVVGHCCRRVQELINRDLRYSFGQ